MGPAELDRAKLPRHVAIVLDERPGHRAAEIAEAAAACRIVEHAAELGVGVLTLCGSKELCALLERAGVPEAASGEVRVQLKAERGREEILDAARRIAQDVQRGRLLPHAVDAGTIDRYLERQELPELDLLICTGGRRRLSNYLLWQAAYAEMFIAEEVWAEFGREAFVAALVSYQARERRYGRVPAPAAAEPLSLSKAG
jgi:undecaprenyl pyrophosphate synthase